MMRLLRGLLWLTGLLIAIGSFVAGWLAINGRRGPVTPEAAQSIGLFFVTVAPFYLMILGLWPRRWNLLLNALRKILEPEWGVFVFDWLTVAGLVAFPLIGAILAVAEGTVLLEVHGWVWMLSVGAVHVLRRRSLVAYVEGRDA